MSETKQELISKALRGEIPAEQWMVKSRQKAGWCADEYAQIMSCSEHVKLATENFKDAKLLQGLIPEKR